MHRLIVLGLLMSVAATPRAAAQFVTLQGRNFILDGAQFYPRVMNYHLTMVSNQMNSVIPAHLFVSPNREYDALVHPNPDVRADFECGTSTTCLAQLKEHFDKAVSMGFNTVRLSIGPYMRKDEFGNWYYSLHIDHNEYPERSEGHYRLDLGSFNFVDDLSEHFFELLRRVLDTADLAGVKVILICAEDEGGYLNPEQLTMAWNEDAVNLYTIYLGRLADELKDHPALLAYDLWNEPIWTSYDLLDWRKADVCRFTEQWYDAINDMDPNHLVTLDGSAYHELGSWDPAVMKIDFYSPHEYPEPSFLDGYDLTNTFERVKAQLYWQARTCTMPWLLGETGFSAENDDFDPLDYFILQENPNSDNQHLNGADATHEMPMMHGSEEQQSAYAVMTMDATRNYLGSGYSWWGFQNTRGANLNSRPKDFRENWFSPLKFGNETDVPGQGAPWNTAHRWRDKDMVSVLQNYVLPAAPPTLPAPPANYYNWQALPESVYRTYGIKDQNDEAIVDGIISPEWFYKSLSGLVWRDESLTDHRVTDDVGMVSIWLPPLIVNSFYPRDEKRLLLNASGAWRKLYDEDQWPGNGYIETLHRNRLYFSTTIDDITVGIGDYQEMEAWSELTVSNTLIEGSETTAGSANFRARDWIHIVDGFHAEVGSEVHIYLDETWVDCTDESYMAGLAPEPELSMEQQGRAKMTPLGLVLRFQQPELSIKGYPNPCTDQFQVFTNTEGGFYTLTDIYGRIVAQASYSSSNCIVQMDRFATGPYLLSVSTSLGRCTITMNKLP